MKKKLLALMMVSVLSLSMLTACGDAADTAEVETAEEAAEEVEEEAEEAEEAVEEAAEDAEASAEELYDSIEAILAEESVQAELQTVVDSLLEDGTFQDVLIYATENELTYELIFAEQLDASSADWSVMGDSMSEMGTELAKSLAPALKDSSAPISVKVLVENADKSVLFDETYSADAE